jgi:hypothetical protein
MYWHLDDRTASGTFRDGDIIINRDGLRVISQDTVSWNLSLGCCFSSPETMHASTYVNVCAWQIHKRKSIENLIQFWNSTNMVCSKLKYSKHFLEYVLKTCSMNIIKIFDCHGLGICPLKQLGEQCPFSLKLYIDLSALCFFSCLGCAWFNLPCFPM